MTANKDDMQLQTLQKKAHSRFILMILIGVIVLFLLLAFFIWCSYLEYENNLLEDLPGIVLASAAFTAGTLWGLDLLFFTPAYRKFNDVFKRQYVLNTMKEAELFEEVSYDPSSGFGYMDICNWGVVDCGDDKYFQSEDMLSGIYKGTRFHIGDVKTRRYVRSNKYKKLETIFSGQIIRFERFDNMKISEGHLQVFQKDFFRSLRGWTTEHQIQTENMEFNDLFEVYAADEHNAFYILTPLLMEKIIHFAATIDEQIAITFWGPHMFVAVARLEGMFDASLTEPVLKQKQAILDDAKHLQCAGDILLSGMIPH